MTKQEHLNQLKEVLQQIYKILYDIGKNFETLPNFGFFKASLTLLNFEHKPLKTNKMARLFLLKDTILIEQVLTCRLSLFSQAKEQVQPVLGHLKQHVEQLVDVCEDELKKSNLK